ncbi:MAG: phosphate-starvation-inducible PsiE family protein [Cytophagaceae bacterium]|nr:phosphate-starvation-inducible PsiE family protein [Cytophagaceae bacterium]
MENSDKFSKIRSTINKNVIRVLIGLMNLSIILASLHLIYLVYQKVMDAPVFVIYVAPLFDIFDLILIIVVGYELTKSLILIISSDRIPIIPIVQIAMIAVANKIITLDIKYTGYWFSCFDCCSRTYPSFIEVQNKNYSKIANSLFR